MILHFKKGHKKAFAISIVNLYFVALLWFVSGAIAFKYVFISMNDIFYFMIYAALTLLAALVAKNRSPIHLYLEFRDVILSKFMIFICLSFSIILFYGQRGDNGIDFQEVSTLLFSIISISFIMTFIFEILHTDKWYNEKFKNDQTDFLS